MSKDGASELLELLTQSYPISLHHTKNQELIRRVIRRLFCSQHPCGFACTIAVTDGVLHVKRIALRISCLTSL